MTKPRDEATISPSDGIRGAADVGRTRCHATFAAAALQLPLATTRRRALSPLNVRMQSAPDPGDAWDSHMSELDGRLQDARDRSSLREKVAGLVQVFCLMYKLPDEEDADDMCAAASRSHDL